MIKTPPSIKILSLKPQFDCLIRKCKSVKQFKQLHAQIIIQESFLSHESSLPQLCKLASFCAVSPHGNLSYAKTIFDQQPNPTLQLYNALIRGFSASFIPQESMLLFREMLRNNVVPNNMTFPFVIKACTNGKSNETLALFDEMKFAGVRANEATVVTVLSAIGQVGGLDQGLQLHLYINENGFKINPIVSTALIDMYVKCGNIAEALKVFNSMQTKDILAWNTMVIGMGMHGHVNDAQQMFKQMQLEGIVPNDVTFVAMLGAFRHAGMTEEGQKLLSSMKSVYGVEPKIEHYGCVIDLLSRAGRLDEALNLIKNMPFEPNEYIYGALLGGCKIHGNAKVAQSVGKHLLDLDPQHGGRYVVLSNIYAGAKRWDDATATRKLMQDNGVAKMAGVSVIELMEDLHSFVAGDRSKLK
ncbi:hypothetical protein E3N88_46188 [Mikania micrantha]|uniref:Pentacotripeptide-repeat region of PRORP domain-containing protein n=1 Tax=Mikania micrantha TaxID=192012 RepID=A0A5N6L7A0_9ASTR|nr:hypothetical protein E3N88_46188 [Mikania micrantha]